MGATYFGEADDEKDKVLSFNPGASECVHFVKIHFAIQWSCALSCRDIQKSISKLSLQICILLAFFVFTLYKTVRIGISSHVSTCLIYIVIKNNF